MKALVDKADAKGKLKVVPPPDRRRTVSAELADQVVEAYRAGDGIAVIGRRLHLGFYTIDRVLHERGIPKRGAGQPKNPDLSKAIELYLSGLSMAVAANRAGIKIERLERNLRKQKLIRQPTYELSD